MINPIKHQFNFEWNAHNSGIERVHVAKYNEILVTSSSEEIKVWILEYYSQYIEQVVIDIFEDDINTMALSEEGNLLAFAGKNKKLSIWRIN